MNLRLKSDFIDYYDRSFDRVGPVFKRFSKNDITRQQIFSILKTKLQMKVPMHGKCSEMGEHFRADDKVVVYTDELAHCGEGKELLNYREALKNYPNTLIAEYLKGEGKSVSVRYLGIGDKSFFLAYCSDDEWRSNCGDVKVSIVGTFDYTVPKIDVPLFAIDFVKDCSIFYAVDFNTSPGIKGTGIEELVEPSEVVELIKNKLEKIMTK